MIWKLGIVVLKFNYYYLNIDNTKSIILESMPVGTINLNIIRYENVYTLTSLPEYKKHNIFKVLVERYVSKNEVILLKKIFFLLFSVK